MKTLACQGNISEFGIAEMLYSLKTEFVISICKMYPERFDSETKMNKSYR